jgi:hypothetical protein
MSIAMNMCQTCGSHLLYTSFQNDDHDNTQHNMSTAADNQYHLWLQILSNHHSLSDSSDLSISHGLQHGSQHLSTASHSGIIFHSFDATSSFHLGTMLVAKSISQGNSSQLGAQMAIGFVHNIASLQLVGTTRGAVFVIVIQIIPFSVAILE